MLLDAVGFEPATVDVLAIRTGSAGRIDYLDVAGSRARGAHRTLPWRPLWPHTLMMTGTVLDILIYVFDRYMLDEVPEVPEREHLARDLERVGFAHANVERALDWLADLALERDRPPLAIGPAWQRARGAHLLGRRAGAAVDRMPRLPGDAASGSASCRRSSARSSSIACWRWMPTSWTRSS